MPTQPQLLPTQAQPLVGPDGRITPAWYQALTRIAAVVSMVRTGNGTPEGAVAAPVGTLYLRTDGGANTTLYVKESGSGNTGWVAK